MTWAKTAIDGHVMGESAEGERVKEVPCDKPRPVIKRKLMGTNEIDFPCGCKVNVRGPNLADRKLCPTHSAAPEMHNDLTRLRQDKADLVRACEAAADNGMRIVKVAQAAIKATK